MQIAGQDLIEGVAAGVPFVALPPADRDAAAPLIVTWHMMSPPCTEYAMAAAIPMTGLQAWKVHLGLPMFGRRLPEGGFEEFYRLASEDVLVKVYDPVARNAAAELPGAVAALRSRLSIEDGPIGVVGGSAGGLVALEVLARADVEIGAAALVNPVSQLAPMIAANERLYGMAYNWSDESRALAGNYDYVRRAGEIRQNLLMVIGGEDDVAIREPAAAVVAALGERAEQVVIPGMPHELADAPGIEPAPQTEYAVQVDAELTKWFSRHLK
jgi:pimeloyl-ACP methyl ester carboxylesterase